MERSAAASERTGDSPRGRWILAIVRRVMHRTRRQPVADPDSQVQMWKASWVAGAHARWAGRPSHANPYEARSARSDAWTAGWRWAEGQPDRRSATRLRLAHPRRRTTDTGLSQMRTLQAGAIGISGLMLVRWLWQTRKDKQSARGRRERVSP
jgi:hypothetical protein